MDTFLSIDFDYWGNSKRLPYRGFIERIVALNVPFRVYKSHEQILELLNLKAYGKLINVDYHSDIVFEALITPRDPLTLNEGTWANFYKYRSDCIFEWRYPLTESFKVGEGICDEDISQPYDSIKRIWSEKLMGYKRAIHRKGIADLRLKDVSTVGFVISENWWHRRDVSDIAKYISTRKWMPVKKNVDIDDIL